MNMKFFISNKHHSKFAFTLIEVMLLLVVVSLIFASSTAIITRKHKLKPRRTVHGQYLCYRNNDGTLHEIMYSGRSLLLEHNQATDPTFTQCSFEAPRTAPYLYIQVIGGGGGGGQANYNPNYNAAKDSLRTEDIHGKVAGAEYKSKIPLVHVSKEVNFGGLSYNPEVYHTPTVEDVQSFNWEKNGEKVNFSIRAFDKIVKDTGLKFFAYQYAGTAGDAGHATITALLPSKEEVAPTDPPNTYYWYKSVCALSHDSVISNITPEGCLKRLIQGNTNFVWEDGSTQKFKDLGQYCQLRYPLYKNCPILAQAYVPKSTDVTCFGNKGGKGGLLVSPVEDFKLGRTFIKGVYSIQKTPDSTSTIDYPLTGITEGVSVGGHGANCIGEVAVLEPDYANFLAGTYLSTAESCGSGIPNASCKDSVGHPIKDGKNKNVDGTDYITSNYDYKYFQNSREVCTPIEPPITDEEGNIIKDKECRTEYFTDYGNTANLINDAFYFKQYPKAPFVIVADDVCEQEAEEADTGYGLGTGMNGGLPYTLDKTGAFHYGLALCDANQENCNYYTKTNSNILKGDILSTGAGGRPIKPSDIVDINTGIPKKILSNGQPACPLSNTQMGTAGVNGDRDATYPTSYGAYHYCYNNIGIFTNEKGKNVYRLVNNSYACPTKTGEPNATNTLGIKLQHKHQARRLSYGDHGRAGQYVALFARSLGSASLKMEPGKGGEPAAPTASNLYKPGEQGKPSLLGVECTGSSMADCKTQYSAIGGVGGKSLVWERSFQIDLLNNKDIWEYLTQGRRPEPRYSENYTTSDPAMTYHGEDSDFQRISYLSDLSELLADKEDLKNIGKGGDGGYIKHNCWLQIQYFFYYKVGYSTAVNSSDVDQIYNVSATDVTTYPEQDEWEGYNNFSEKVIKQVCGDDYLTQYEETPGTRGYSGAIVIMW